MPLTRDQPAMNVVTSFCVLLACFLPVNAVTLTACKDGQMDIVHGTQASIKCTELFANRNYTWSITTPSTGAERTIGTCELCPSSPCPACDVPDTDYTITRGRASAVDVSTVRFVANEADHHNTTIRCALSDSPPGVTCTIHVIEVYRLSGCFVVENAQTSISCSYREPSHGMYWSITYLNGSYSTVAECAPCVNNTCPDCDVNNTDFTVTRDQNSSVIQMVNGRDVDKDGAKLQCSRNDNVTADMCTIKVFYYKLPQCDGGQLDVSEVEPWTTVRCEGLRQTQNMNWTITDDSYYESQIAYCDAKQNCTTRNSDVIVSRENQFSSLTFVGSVREKDNTTLTCVERNGVTADSCRIRTFYPAETNNATVRVDSNFTVTGRVYIDKVYASDNNITCQWYHTLIYTREDELLTSLSLSTFTDTDGLEYQRGHCDMTLSVNSSEIIIHFFGVVIQPSNEMDQFAGAVTIEEPEQNLTTTCPDYVSEGNDLTCECSHLTAQNGNPPATISWLTDTGTAVLHVSNVSRQLNGTDYICTSVWGAGMPEVQSSVDYTLLVAYGPESVTLNGSAYYITADLQNVTLTCTWEEVYPSVNVTWSVACMNLTFSLDNSACTIDTALIKNVSGVTCTAVNTGIPQLHATDVFTFLFEEPGPNLTTTCPDYVSEGSDLTCECSHLTAQHGNPPATISWRDVTDTAGLHISNVSRNMNGTEYACSSVWGEGRPEEVRSSDNYTMLVAYGPNTATVYVSGDDSDDPNIMTLTCTSDVAYPSVNFNWSVACVTFNFTPANSTCTIDMDSIDVREVVCTAFNAKFPEINATRLHAFLFKMTLQSLSPSLELTTIGATVTTNPSKVQNTATLTLKYVLLTVCTHEKENEVATTVHARIVTQSEEWPGLCRDDDCSNAFVTATCDGIYSKSITTIVEITQVPDTLPSKVNQTAVSTEIVLVRAAQDDAFDLKTIDAVLKKAEVLIKLIKTCTRGYTYTGTECVKQDEPSSSSTVVLGASIGGVFGFLVVLILVVLVVVIYRRLGWQHAGRQARHDAEHDYSALAIAGQSTASGHSGRQGPMQLSPLGFELDKSSFGKQHERPVSDYDVIGMENPNIASLLTKTCCADEDPCNPYDECDGYDEAGHGDGKVQNSPPEKAANRKGDDSDYLTPSMKRESTDAENPPDYLTLCSPQDMSDDVNYSDYLTPQPKLEKSDDPNYSD